MPPPAVRLIHEQHRALAAVLCSLRDTVGAAGKSGVAPDFEQLRLMLFYMDEMPARLHHAIEGELLFPRIRERCPPLRPVLERLEAEHGRGESTVQELERALTAWQVLGSDRREAFELPLRVYVQGYLGHMEVEDNYVLPVAEEYLSEADWQELDLAFSRLHGGLSEPTVQGHRGLLERILSTNLHPPAPCKTSKCPS
jgi:hemerythrin-like domain-containing protein